MSANYTVTSKNGLVRLGAVFVLALTVAAAPVEFRPAQASILGGAIGGAVLGGIFGGRGGAVGGAIVGGVAGGIIQHNKIRRKRKVRAYRQRMNQRKYRARRRR